MAVRRLKIPSQLLTIERKPRQGLLPVEWAVLSYTVLTTLLMLFMWTELVNPLSMLWLRFQAIAILLAMWWVYSKYPCPLIHFVRVGSQMAMLGVWYPDTYEFNRLLPNLDHLFASAEQSLFGFQPALLFSQYFSHPIVSEPLALGYVSYYPLIALVILYYFLQRYELFDHAVFTVMASFFLFYLIFIFLPVAGPQYYYLAAGLDQIRADVFPDVGRYFADHQESLPIPGWDHGFFYQMVRDAHDAGERPTAAFPSSHVGITVVLLWLAHAARCKWLFWLIMPFAVLMFFATFYIQAHYAIDAIAGVFAGTLIYFIACGLSNKLIHNS